MPLSAAKIRRSKRQNEKSFVVYYNMTQTETTNIIIALRNEGWAADKINDFITFVSTHKPSEEEAGSGKYDFSKKK